MHKIEVDLSPLPEGYRNYIKAVVGIASEVGVDVWLSADRLIPYQENNSSLVNGFFVDEPKPKLAVGCGQSFEKWFLVFLHESCHMQQWLDMSPYWIEGKVGGVEAVAILDLWMQGWVELLEEKKWHIIRSVRNVELDCERRAVAVINRFNFNVGTEFYIQRANAYVLFYNMIGYFKQWYTAECEPYNISEIYSVMPKVFFEDSWYEPENMSSEIFAALHKCL